MLFICPLHKFIYKWPIPKAIKDRQDSEHLHSHLRYRCIWILQIYWNLFECNRKWYKCCIISRLQRVLFFILACDCRFIICFAKGRYRIIHGKNVVSQINIFQGQSKEIYIVINFKMRTKWLYTLSLARYLLTGAAKYVPRNKAARKTAKYKNFWVVMRQARNIDGCFFIRKYSENRKN